MAEGARPRQSFVCSLGVDARGDPVAFLVEFGGETSRSIRHSATAAEVKALLEELPGIESVDVELLDSAGNPVTAACSPEGHTVRVSLPKHRGHAPPVSVQMPAGSAPTTAVVEEQGLFLDDEVTFETDFQKPREVQVLTCTCAAACSGAFVLRWRGKVTQLLQHDSPVARQHEEGGSSAGSGTGSSLQAQLDAIAGFQVVERVDRSGIGTSLCQDSSTVQSHVTFLPTAGPSSPITLYSSGPSLSLSIITEFDPGSMLQQCSGRGTCSSGKCECDEGFMSTGKGASAGNCGQYFGGKTCPGTLGTPPDEIPCNGHGSCSGPPLFECQCADQYEGHDCALRRCPRGRAWFDEATSDDHGHRLAICSNKGICQSASGVCACQPGFEGAACERLACPASEGGACGRGGRCVSLADSMDAWRTQGERPFSSPETVLREVQSIRCGLDGVSPGQTHLQLALGADVTGALPASATAAELKGALEQLPSISAVTVELFQDVDLSVPAATDEVCSAAGTYAAITFTGATTPGPVPELSTSDALHIQVSEHRPAFGGPVQVVSCVDAGALSGTYTLSWGGASTVALPASGVLDPALSVEEEVATAIEALPGAGNVDVTLIQGSDATGLPRTTGAACSTAPGTSILVQFQQPSLHHTKIPLLSASSTGSVSVTVSWVQQSQWASYGKRDPANASVWDASKLQGCVCGSQPFGNSSSWTGDAFQSHGVACEEQQCPWGVNPRVPAVLPLQHDPQRQLEQQTITCTGTSGSFKLRFRGQESTEAVDSADSSAALESVLESLSSIGAVDVQCSASTVCAGGAGVKCVVSFLTELGDLPQLQVLPAAGDGTGRALSLNVWETQKGSGQVEPCSGRGTCQTSPSQSRCDCLAGYASSGGPGVLGARGDCGYQLK